MTDIIIGQDPTKLSTNALQPPVAVVAPPRKTFSRLYGKHDVLDGEYNLSQKLLAELIGTTYLFTEFVVVGFMVQILPAQL